MSWFRRSRPLGTGSDTRVESLDGIRALAVVAVLAGHASYNHYPGGFLGVEVFFVLSGFLITTLLTREFRKTGRISRRAFYMRRFLRLGPALVLGILLANVLTIFTPRRATWRRPNRSGSLGQDSLVTA